VRGQDRAAHNLLSSILRGDDNKLNKIDSDNKKKNEGANKPNKKSAKKKRSPKKKGKN